MGSGGGGADAPDTVGAARETGEQARRLNEAQTAANRPNQYNAWGSTEWSNAPVWDETTGQYINQWSQTETLDPRMQKQLDAQMNIGAGRGPLAQGMMGRVWDDMSTPADFDQFGSPIAYDASYDPAAERQRAEDAAYGRSTARLDSQFESRQADLESRLRNQGLTAGDQAYDAAMNNLGTERTDAYDMARMGAVGEGRQETQLGMGQKQLSMSENDLANQLRSQGMQEMLQQRGYSLAEMERIMGGQVKGGPPSTGGTTEAETVSTKNLGGG